MQIVRRVTVALLIWLCAVTPVRAYGLRDTLFIATTAASAVAFSKFAYDMVASFDTYSLPLCVRIGLNLILPGAPIGVITIHGPITSDIDTYVAQIQYYAQHPSIKGILVVICSGGGHAGSSEVLYRELCIARKHKPIVAFIADMCCSGAYQLACGTSHIMCTQQATIGSIGAYQIFKRFVDKPKGWIDYDKGTVEYEYIAAGKYKTTGSPYTPLTDEQRKYIQQNVNNVNEIFCSIVAHERNLSLDERESWAEGKVFSGDQALTLGLVDSCGSLSDAREVLLEEIRKKEPHLSSTRVRAV